MYLKEFNYAAMFIFSIGRRCGGGGRHLVNTLIHANVTNHYDHDRSGNLFATA
jgi:hypothetical protein